MFSILKFTWILICFLTAAGTRRFCYAARDWALLTVGMAFTLVSDFFLVLYDNRPVGTVVFCFVHAVYFIRVCPLKRAWVPPLTVLCLLPLFAVLDGLDATVIIYACLFVEDLTINILLYKRGDGGLPKVNHFIITAGLILFALCDVNVLLFNLPLYIDVPAWLPKMGYTLIWVFYAPSQLLLAVSALRLPNCIKRMNAGRRGRRSM